jgi:hypothetical protein
MDLKSFKSKNASTHSVGSGYSSPDSLASRMRSSDTGRKFSKLIGKRRSRRGSRIDPDALDDEKREEDEAETETEREAKGKTKEEEELVLNLDSNASSSLLTSGSDEDL